MNIQDIYDLMDRFEESSMTEFKLSMEGMKLTCKKSSSGDDFSSFIDDRSSKKSNEAVKKVRTETFDNDKLEVDGKNFSDKKINNTDNVFEIKSKVAGTFYRAASPENEPFIQLGQKIKKGDVIGMIEAMKMMNEITSPVDGTVAEIAAKNEELVGFDSVLVSLTIN